jgi:hypothetical protein
MSLIYYAFGSLSLYFRTQTGGSEGGGEIRRRLGSFGRKKGPAVAAASEEKYSSNESITSAYGTYLSDYFVYFSKHSTCHCQML